MLEGFRVGDEQAYFVADRVDLGDDVVLSVSRHVFVVDLRVLVLIVIIIIIIIIITQFLRRYNTAGITARSPDNVQTCFSHRY